MAPSDAAAGSSNQSRRRRYSKKITDQTPDICQASADTPTKRRGGERRGKRKGKSSTRGSGDGRREVGVREESPGSRLKEVEDKLAFDEEMLPAFSKSSPSSSSSPCSCLPPSFSFSFSSSDSSLSDLLGCQAAEIGRRRCEPNLGFLPQIDKWLFVSLREADFYYGKKKYTVAASRLNSALQLCSKGCVLDEALSGDVEDIDRVLSYIQARLAVCYLKMKRPEVALSHAHRSEDSHTHTHTHGCYNNGLSFKIWKQCHFGKKASVSVLTADWLYCLAGGTERHISTQLKLYWQAMLEEALTAEEQVSVMFTPHSGDPTAEDVSRAEDAFRKQHPAFTAFIYTEPTGGHILPPTTDWLSAAPPQLYLLTLGFRRAEAGRFLQNLHARAWPSLTGRRWEDEAVNCKLCDVYKNRILPVLDLMQATRIDVSVCVGSGLIERLQYSSLLAKAGLHREYGAVLQRCQARLATAPYLQEGGAQRADKMGYVLTWLACSRFLCLLKL
uniref:Spermatosis associated 16 n=1 Tax=Myripristis murdjan TaxID=586833 RepID=A0A668A5W4_9TELE